MGLNKILNQKRAKQHLLMALKSGRLPNAFLFSGPRGVGKTTTALILARILDCERMEFDSCDSCQSCERAHRFQHPEIEFVFPIPSWSKDDTGDESKRAALRWSVLSKKIESPLSFVAFDQKTSISINEIRLLSRASSTRILHGKWRVFIVSRAEKMTPDAQNAFLKLLEEPRENTLIILVTSKPHLLLPTVLSRCQEVKFGGLPEQHIRDALVEWLSVPAEKAQIIASLSQGSLGRALELTEEAAFEERRAAVEFLTRSLSNEIAPLVGDMERISYERDYSFVERLVENLLLFHMDVLSFQNGGEKDFFANKDMIDLIKAESERTSFKETRRRVAIFLKALEAVDRNVDPGLILHEVSYQLGTHH
ncbi:MAG: AAA family ATPase [Candidatus Eisenbacteria bacterium]|nr:AAA family ATPase [Candidatus Eisenbacteria bacterium]